MIRTVLATVLIILTHAGLAVAGGQLHPTQEGWQWKYISSGGEARSSEISGYTTIRGRDVSIKHFVGTSFEVYISVTESGDLLWHGLEDTAGVYGGIFVDPPLKLVSSGAYVGDGWTIYSKRYDDRNAEVPCGPTQSYTFIVTSIDSVSVPAGRFAAIAVKSEPVYFCGAGAWSPGGGLLVDLGTLEKQLQPADSINTWYSPGVGVVRSQLNRPIYSSASELLEWSEPPLSVEHKSWGSLRAIYR